MRSGKRIRWRIAFWSAVALSAWGWFGLLPSDAASVRTFDERAKAWQFAPEFRAVATEYSTHGSRALATRPLGFRAGGVVMALRSLPFLPKNLAVNPTSALHYQRFSNGPLEAYLHLCSEQDAATFARVLEETAARQPDPTACGREFLAAFHMEDPVCTDAGAVQSAATLVRDVAPQRPLTVRENVNPLLLPHIRVLAQELGVPPDVGDMSPAQQRAILDRLDAHVHGADPELWRTKQLNDFCSGVWAQVFGPTYGLAIKPFLLAHQAAGVILVALLLYGVAVRSRRKPVAEPTPNPSPPVMPPARTADSR